VDLDAVSPFFNFFQPIRPFLAFSTFAWLGPQEFFGVFERHGWDMHFHDTTFNPVRDMVVFSSILTEKAKAVNEKRGFLENIFSLRDEVARRRSGQAAARDLPLTRTVTVTYPSG
jgi:hypothetical protein